MRSWMMGILLAGLLTAPVWGQESKEKAEEKSEEIKASADERMKIQNFTKAYSKLMETLRGEALWVEGKDPKDEGGLSDAQKAEAEKKRKEQQEVLRLREKLYGYGCEDSRPQADLRRNKKPLDPNSVDPDHPELQGALKQFPFIKIREYDGEKLVERFRAPNGELWADQDGIIRVCISAPLVSDDGIYSQGDLSIGAQLQDREIAVEGYAQVGKNYEKFKPSVLRPEKWVTDYATIQVNVEEAIKDGADADALIRRSNVIGQILSRMLDGTHAVYAVTRITARSEDDLKDRAKALKDSAKHFATVRADLSANREQVEARLAEVKQRLAALDVEIQDAVEKEADLAADPNADAKAKEAARALTVHLSASHRQLRLEKGVLGKRLATLVQGATEADKTAMLRQARSPLESALHEAGQLFSLDPEMAALVIHEYTSRLRPAQIFLSKEDAKPGDILRIKMLHFPPDFESDGKTVKNAPLEQTIAEIHIDDFGWRTEVADSFLLVKAADKKISNFTGAAGASLLWSPRPRPRFDAWYLTTIRSLRPSFGFNVSYLDFDEKKELEIGAGVVIGLFDNAIHVGRGWNLNYDGDDRSYFFLGFSFGKIQEKLTGDTD